MSASSTSMRRAERIASHVAASASVASIPSDISTGLRLEGQVAIVTGAAQGIGLSCAKLFAKNGCMVVLSDIDEAKAAKAAQEIDPEGKRAVAICGDITDPEFPEKLLSGTVERFGTVNILVNNAGFTWDGVIHRMSDEQWAKMLDVHCTAVFRLIRAASPIMRDPAKAELEAGKVPQNRVIINISSTSGLHGNAGQINYSTAKLGVVGLTKTVAKEWGGFGIRCNAVAFGFIQTRLTASKESGAVHKTSDGKEIKLGIPQAQLDARQICPLARFGNPDEAAAGIVMLASPLSSYITGHCLEVTGGAGI